MAGRRRRFTLRAVRRSIADVLVERTTQRCVPLSTVDVERPAVVLAPHPDDEVLGCGGLVACKRTAGVPVTVVFMTDGAASHAGAVEREELAARRRREALAACDVLGVPAGSVHFLDIPDGCLADSTAGALAQLEAILGPVGDRQVVAPHPGEPPADHVATYDVARRWATRGAAVGAEMLLYPVWLWDQWPFTNPLSGPRRGSIRSILRTGLTQGGGLRLGRRLDHRLDIGDVLPVKRAALAEHASQTVRPPDRPDWPTLGDVAGGDWLDLLLRPVELYALRAPEESRSTDP